ncbi:hypothetical protein [Labrys sp. La1]|uniref:hypothetical protein n=1 Tax=Labrys sp. La1 TaxID=3404917 RepID=UPI003EC0AF4A
MTGGQEPKELNVADLRKALENLPDCMEVRVVSFYGPGRQEPISQAEVESDYHSAEKIFVIHAD